MYKLRVSSSIVGFREKAEKKWGIGRYRFPKDIFRPAVFFGLYHIVDYAYFLAHRGKKYVLWAGHDLVNFRTRASRVLIKELKRADNYVENGVEQKDLQLFGIQSKIRPSYVGVDFPITFTPSDNPQVFLSANAGRQGEYGWRLVYKIADKVPEVTFHLYGAEKEMKMKNIMFHKRVSNEQFNEEIQEFHCGLRPNEHDGNSEIAMKSVLCGGYPITRIKYPYIDNYETEDELVGLLGGLKDKKEPNYLARTFWKKNINRYPWLN